MEKIELTEQEEKEILELSQLDDYNFLFKIFDKKVVSMSWTDTGILVQLPHNSISFYFCENKMTNTKDLMSANVFWGNKWRELND